MNRKQVQVTKITALTPSDFLDMPYAPALLLDSCLDASITDNPDFNQSCKAGYEEYFEGMYECDQRGRRVFVGKSCSLPDLLTYVRWVVVGDDLVFIGETMAWRVGSVLGWLSALALTDSYSASIGIAYLRDVVYQLRAGLLEEVA